MILFKGKKRGMIHTMDIRLDHLRAVFFPRNFYEKYQYLGAVPHTYKKPNPIFQVMEPLVIFMDYKARPWWCPRFVLRFLHLFGNDNSIVRVRNKYLSDLKCRLTDYILLWDYKTKWTNYDLRISLSGTDQIWDLAHAIETKFYEDGYREDLASQIKELDPDTKFHKGHTAKMLKEELDRLEKDSENIKDFICD